MTNDYLLYGLYGGGLTFEEYAQTLARIKKNVLDRIEKEKETMAQPEITITLPNGVKMTGPRDVMEIVSKNYRSDSNSWSVTAKLPINYPDGIHYNSSSKGMIKISDMELTHLKRTYAKLTREAVAAMDKMNDKDYGEHLTAGFYKDITLRAIYKELERRLTPQHVGLYRSSFGLSW